MRFLLPVIAILSAVAAAAPGAKAERAWVETAPDGATLVLADGRTLVLDGLLAPAPADDGAAPEADRAAATATAALLAAIGGREAAFAPLLPAPDRWGRIPADVARPADGAWLQGLMLAEGHARLEACPRGDDARIRRLRAAEAVAREARLGLWALAVYRPRRADRPMRPAGFQVVEGLALATGGGGMMRYLNFDKDWRKDFTLRAERRFAARLEALGLGFESLVGRKVRARGWLNYRNGPMLHISCARQVEAISE